jgi:hypothetical protein
VWDSKHVNAAELRVNFAAVPAVVAPTSRAVAVQSALGLGRCDRKIFFLVTCSLQYAKAGSAETLPQQEKATRQMLIETALSEQWHVDPRGGVPSASSRR